MCGDLVELGEECGEGDGVGEGVWGRLEVWGVGELGWRGEGWR